MLGFFERQRLARKGITPQKTRRRLTQSEVVETLEHGVITRVGLIIAAVAVLVWLLAAGRQAVAKEAYVVVVLIFSTAVGHLCLNRREVWTCNSRLLLTFLIVLGHLALAKLCVLQSAAAVHSSGGQFSALQQRNMWLLAIPFGLGPVLASVLLGRTMAIFVSVFSTLLLLPIFASLNDDTVFIVTNVTCNLVCGFIAIFLTAEVRKRGDLPRAGLFVGLTTWMLAIAFRKINLLQMWVEGTALNYQSLAAESIVAIGAPIMMTLIIVGGLPWIESLFHITTRVRWLELADLNHPLLRRMTIEAPGTFQHSLAVANLAEGACEAIGANPAMARVCSYFHDIGKLVKPEYFTENMRHDRNPHDDIAPTMSALIIVAHVKEGISLALEHKLNQDIIDVIREHHGTSLVYYFYKKALDQQQAAHTDGKIAQMHDEELPEVSESSFRYGGPKPRTRESAIVSLADSIESAARSLERVTPQKIEQLITDIIRKRTADGQLDDCDLRFKDLELIAEAFRHTLSSMMHSRVAYPDDKDTKTKRGSGAMSAIRRRDASAA
ncbi:MAG: HDIG domain-containing protein [Verrucomicrobia bacterium]|nr:HDIG domain-containing protein [Verrucomicrobiota bacterium]